MKRSVLIIALLLAANSVCKAQSYTNYTSDTGGADAYVRADSYADTSYGSEETVEVGMSGWSTPDQYTRKAYLRFALPSIPGTKEIGTAALKLILTGQSTTSPDNAVVGVYGLRDGDSGEDWDEATITWNNAPQNATNISRSFMEDAVYLGGFTVVNGATAGTEHTFANKALSNFLNTDTDGQVTLLLSHNNPVGLPWYNYFASQNDTNGYHAPELDLELAPLSAPQPVTTITTHDGVGADALIYHGSGNDIYNNAGFSTSLTITYSPTASYWRKVYMRFDLSSLPPRNVESVALKLLLRFENFSSATHTVNVYGLNDGDAGEGWGEDGICWDNAPQNLNTCSTFNDGATLLGSFDVANNTVIPTTCTFSSTELTTFLNNDTDDRVTLMLSSGGTDQSVSFASRDSTDYEDDPPTLEVEMATRKGTMISIN